MVPLLVLGIVSNKHLIIRLKTFLLLPFLTPSPASSLTVEIAEIKGVPKAQISQSKGLTLVECVT